MKMKTIASDQDNNPPDTTPDADAGGDGASKGGAGGSTSMENATSPDKSPPCPICGKPSQARFQPFCSARCSDVDLNRWLKGTYVIPGKPVTDEEED